jgi:light-regulated signal transduction histidine kinase (bacteriophytochrome)
MDLLIENLLQLSRVTRASLKRQPVHLSAMAEVIVGELRKTEPQRAVNSIIAPDLWAVGDEALLRIALDHLLRNSWKFTAGKSPAAIELGRTPEPESAFYIRDNGAGFDMAYAGKLFGVFQRLHSNSEFPGTGVGLATVQRIIVRHGGRL